MVIIKSQPAPKYTNHNSAILAAQLLSTHLMQQGHYVHITHSMKVRYIEISVHLDTLKLPTIPQNFPQGNRRIMSFEYYSEVTGNIRQRVIEYTFNW